MKLVLFALRHPVTVLVALVAVASSAVLAIRSMPVDIFPALGAPAIYVAQPYGGMSPAQMESFLTYNYEYQFFYVNGVEHIESKSIQGVALMKLVFHPGVDMNQAMAQLVASVNRARANTPQGTVPPFIVRYDAGSVPVAQLVFASPKRTVGDLQDIAITRVRPMFASLPGVSAPPPFGASQRSIVVRLNPDRLRSYGVSPEDAIQAVNAATTVLPAGVMRIGDEAKIAETNATVQHIDELLDVPVRVGSGATVYIRDLGTVEDGTDITNGYAHVNGRRTVYIPVTKRADASTLTVINEVKAALPAMRAVVPEDVEIRLEFDQSRYVSGAITNLLREGLAGALLTGLMVLLFLRDWRSALIVVTTIPAALLAAVVGLWMTGQTINIMTLGGLALAVGVLVDEATVEVENIHSHLSLGLPRAVAVVEACRKTAIARMLAMLTILSVFVPAFFMAGVAQQLFVPLALAVGLAMVSSYVGSSTLVPVLSIWWLRHAPQHEEHVFARVQRRYASVLTRVVRWRVAFIALYAFVAVAMLLLLWPRLGTELFPRADVRQLQLRLRAPTGTRIERTEQIALRALDLIRREAGPDHVAISTGYIGTMPSGNPNNTIYLWTSGPHEAVMKVALTDSATLTGAALEERLRNTFRVEMPEISVSFEPGDIVGQVMSFGSPTPIDIAVQGPRFADDRDFAEKIRRELSRVPALRDLQYGQPLDYPTASIDIDRQRAGQLGLTAVGVARSLIAATSSSRFVEPNYWRDPASGSAFQIQVEIPESRMQSNDDLLSLPLSTVHPADGPTASLRDVASVRDVKTLGEIDRYNMARMVSLTANVYGAPLGTVAKQVEEAVARTGTPPRGVAVMIRGQIAPLDETSRGLRTGLLLSMGAIFLLLIAYFQSVRLALTVVSTMPAVLCGVAVALLLTGTTLNVQSFMGAIMAIGIAMANAILLVTFTERHRSDERASVNEAAVAGAANRLRAILMTATAMLAGMVPIALGLGEGGAQMAPLGRAVIGGLAMATLATLIVLPAVYAVLQRNTSLKSASLDPADPASDQYVSDTTALKQAPSVVQG
jgi:multidrug efflux pump subunit AcrB